MTVPPRTGHGRRDARRCSHRRAAGCSSTARSGSAGTAGALLEAGASRVLGLDRDPDALRACRATRSRLSATASSSCTPTTAISDACSTSAASTAVDGALADLGVSSMQLDAEGRGFSFRRDEPLDMRMDQSQGPTAADLLRDVGRRGARQRDLSVRRGALLAAHRAGDRRRRAASAPIATTGQLAQIVRRAMPRRGYQRIDPATRTFQALRIWVNRELDGLDAFLADAARASAGGRAARRDHLSLARGSHRQAHVPRAGAGRRTALRILTKRPLDAGDDEVARNPRARSAKLRAIERLA